MRSITIAALAVLSCVTQSVAEEAQRPRFYFPKEVKRQIGALSHRTTTTTDGSDLNLLGDLLGGKTPASSSTSSGTSDVVVVPVYVYVGADGKTSTTTGKAVTSTPAATVASIASPTQVEAGAVTSATIKDTNLATAVSASSPTTATSATSASDGGLLGGLGSDLSALLGSSTATTTTTSGSAGGLPTTIVQPTSATITTSAHTTTSTDSPNLLSGLLGSSGILGGLTPSSSTSAVPGITVGLSSIITGSASPTSTSVPSEAATGTSASASASATTSSNPGLLPSIPLLSSLLGGSTSTGSTKPSSVAIPTSTGATTTGGLLPSLSIPIIGATTSTSASASVKPSSSAPAIPSGTTSKSALPSVTPTGPSTSPSVGPSVPVSISPSSSVPVSKPTSVPSHTASPSTTKVEPTTTAVAETTTKPTSQSTSATDTPYVPPPVITPTITTTAPTTQQSTGPTQIPGVILPPGGTPETPQNSTLVQFGFNKDLSWPTVATSMNWPDQIYYYTPLGVAYALAVSEGKIVPYWLGPYDTVSSLGYNTTIIKFFVPSDLVDTLNAQRLAPSSDLYQQPNTPNDSPTFAQSSIKNLFSMLNTDIPLVAQLPSGSSTGSGSGSGENSSGAGGNGNNANPADGSASSSSSVRASSVGIGVGAAAGAAAYAGAMFYVARRYRKRKQLHQRSSSVPSAQMSEAGNTGFLTAPNTRISHNSGRTNRTAMISAPVMSENSLGWN